MQAINQTWMQQLKAAEKLNQSNENNDTKKEGIQHTKGRL
jgi:hypothetical protein